ncbi:hypothetical protein ADN00_16675 [Ornatilinea apprima]|uniref:Glycosyltransferase RgtA/B/C/D-like domain-containing protein n=1 Tax=Ornatilinea apprima TaxID=1134406 RepID=A0A0P6XR63_9CHLR|nr:hypothetical protein [Ornatilinea apprima]KPL72103.1 hypothetical protein ADN00_16675 [Ornatilinea apprima]
MNKTQPIFQIQPKKVSGFLKRLLVKIDSINEEKSGSFLIILSFIIGFFTIYVTLYNAADESDVLTLGSLISKGYILYNDYFSHHFPLPYIWTSIIIKLFGSSIQVARLSILILRVLIFYIAMRLSKYYIVIGLTSVSWSLLSYLYLGNMVLYDSLSAIFNTAAIVVTIAILTSNIKDSLGRYFFIGITSSLSVFSDPTKAFPFIVLFIGLFVYILKTNPYKKLYPQQLVYKLLILVFSFSLVGIFFLVYLLATSSFDNFFKDAVLFNYHTYSKYAGSFEVKNLFKQFFSLLDIFNRAWSKNVSPLIRMDNFLELDFSIYTGFLYRFSILTLVLFLISNKNFLAGLILYMYAATNLMRANRLFHSSSFVLLAIFTTFMVLGYLMQVFRKGYLNHGNFSNKTIHNKLIQIVRLVASSLVFLLFLWLNFRSCQFIINNSEKFTYNYNFSNPINSSSQFIALTCGAEDVKILSYPLNPQVYFWSGLEPASSQIFLLPWNAELYQSLVIKELSNQKNVIIVVDQEAVVWGKYKFQEYASNLINFLNENYVYLPSGYYVSTSLYKLCSE